MKATKVMSIIAISLFGLALIICLVAYGDYDYEGAAAWGIIALLYAIPYSIVVLVSSSPKKDLPSELMKLKQLKEAGILTEEEFNEKKFQLLK